MLGEFAVRHWVSVGVFWDFVVRHWVRIEIACDSAVGRPEGSVIGECGPWEGASFPD